MDRITRDQMLMEMAQVVAKRSTCHRRQVGAVLSLDGRVLSMGYAGAPSGFPHCSPLVCDVLKPCTRTVHAEANAIAFAARSGICIDFASLHCTLAPCLDCAKLIINSGIRAVTYLELYRSASGVNLLLDADIHVYHYGKSRIHNHLDAA